MISVETQSLSMGRCPACRRHNSGFCTWKPGPPSHPCAQRLWSCPPHRTHSYGTHLPRPFPCTPAAWLSSALKPGSDEARRFIRLLTRSRARSVPPWLRGACVAACVRRWAAFLRPPRPRRSPRGGSASRCMAQQALMSYRPSLAYCCQTQQAYGTRRKCLAQGHVGSSSSGFLGRDAIGPSFREDIPGQLTQCRFLGTDKASEKQMGPRSPSRRKISRNQGPNLGIDMKSTKRLIQWEQPRRWGIISGDPLTVKRKTGQNTSQGTRVPIL